MEGVTELLEKEYRFLKLDLHDECVSFERAQREHNLRKKILADKLTAKFCEWQLSKLRESKYG